MNTLYYNETTTILYNDIFFWAIGLPLFIILMALFFVIWFLPIIIAGRRNLPMLVTVIIIMMTILLPFWIIALLLSVLAPGGATADTGTDTDNIHALSELHKLHKAGGITKSEFERQKKKLLK